MKKLLLLLTAAIVSLAFTPTAQAGQGKHHGEQHFAKHHAKHHGHRHA